MDKKPPIFHFIYKFLDEWLRNQKHRLGIPRMLFLILIRIVISLSLLIISTIPLTFSTLTVRLASETSTDYHPSVHIFSAPPSLGTETTPQVTRAVLSWLNLEPRPCVTLLGRAEGLREFSRSYGVNHDPFIDHNFLGRPLFNSIILKANKSKSDITVFVHSDIILVQGFLKSLTKLAGSFHHFIAVSASNDIEVVSKNEGFISVTSGEHNPSHGLRNNCGGIELWAWTTGGPRLIEGLIPHFLYGRGIYENWFMDEIILHGARPVVKLSEAVIVKHKTKPRNTSAIFQASGAVFRPKLVKEETLNRTFSTVSSTTRGGGDSSIFEQFLNIHLSVLSGNYHTRAKTRHTRRKISKCNSTSDFCALCREISELMNYEIDQASSHVIYNLDSFGRPKDNKKMSKENLPSFYEIPVEVKETSANQTQFGLPISLLDALSSLTKNGTIVLSALNFGYRSIMMSWVCQMRRLGITNFLVAALDQNLYRFAFVRGVPVYFEDTFEKGLKGAELEEERVYGTSQFERITKMKTRVVLRILRLGYNVLWSDCDIVYFKNPLAFLIETAGDLIIQSNAPDSSPLNGIRRINSGFYLARSNDNLISAFETIVKVAIESNLTEQPCFFDVLCGKEGEYRKGKTMCDRDGVQTVFLNRELFPNGATRNMWQSQPGSILQRFPNAMILHNNWIQGVLEKRKRMLRHGFDVYDEKDEICDFDSFGAVFV